MPVLRFDFFSPISSNISPVHRLCQNKGRISRPHEGSFPSGPSLRCRSSREIKSTKGQGHHLYIHCNAPHGRRDCPFKYSPSSQCRVLSSQGSSAASPPRLLLSGSLSPAPWCASASPSPRWAPAPPGSGRTSAAGLAPAGLAALLDGRASGQEAWSQKPASPRHWFSPSPF